MKKITILILILLAAGTRLQSQVNIVLSMNPRPTAAIGNWQSKRDVLTLVATSLGGGARNIKINTVIKTTDGITVAVTDMLKAPVRVLPQGSNTIFYAADVVNWEAMVFNASFLRKINQTGMLPAGSYQIIVTLDSATSPVAISNSQTKVFLLAAVQLPVLIAPANNSVLNAAAAQTAVIFRWTPVTPKPTDIIRYQLLVFEIAENQRPMQALRGNQPVLNQEITGTTQYVWRPQLGYADSTGRKFIWTIKTLNAQGQPVTGETVNSEGVSEPLIFTIGVQPPPAMKPE